MYNLMNEPIWCCWRYEQRDGKKTKVPKNARTGGNAQPNNPSTWSDYETALNASRNYDGMALMLRRGLIGIDIDGHNTGENALAAELLQLFKGTYAEKSPSGTGYHIIAAVDLDRIPIEERQDKPGVYQLSPVYYVKNSSTEIECYIGGATNRYLTYTGNCVSAAKEVTDQTDNVLLFLEKYMKKPQKQTRSKPVAKTEHFVPTETINDILDKARNAENGNKFSTLFDIGDISSYDDDESKADQALCEMLAFWLNGNAADIDTAFRQSALYREKWERADYRRDTIRNAIEYCNGEFYQPPRRKPGRPRKASQDEPEAPIFTAEALEAELNERGIEVRANDLTGSIDFRNYPKSIPAEYVSNALPAKLYSELKQKYKKITLSDLREFLQVIAIEHHYNPVLEMLNSTQWDGNARLAELYSTYNITDGLSQTLVTKWLIQSLKLLDNSLEHPIAPDGCLVLQGGQGWGKSTFFEKLAIKPEFFLKGGKISSFDKDDERRLLTVWIAELGEIDETLHSCSAGKLKAFLDRSVDRYRLPYAATDATKPRRASICGSTNVDEFLQDPTGNRRFWCVQMTAPADLTTVHAIFTEDYMLQIWCEVRDHYINELGWDYRLTRDEQQELNERNESFRAADPAEDAVKAILEEAAAKPDLFELQFIQRAEFKSMYWNQLNVYTQREINAALKAAGINKENGKEKVVHGVRKIEVPVRR